MKLVVACLIYQFSNQLFTDNMNNAMNEVFKYYNLCNDVAELICQKLHKGHQEEINNHISVMINWNDNFDYWKFNDIRVLSTTLINNKKTNNKFKYSLEVIMDFISIQQRYDVNIMNNLITNKQYLTYISSNKKIFLLNSIPRFSSLIKFCRKKCREYTSLQNPNEEYRIKAINYLKVPMKMMRLIIHSVGILHARNLSSGRVRNVFKTLPNSQVLDPITIKLLLNSTYYNTHYKITKKNLIQFINQNGDSRNLINKSISELWKISINI